MIKIKKNSFKIVWALSFWGLIWFAFGAFLLFQGVGLIFFLIGSLETSSLLSVHLSHCFLGNTKVVLFWICLGLLSGLVIGRAVLPRLIRISLQQLVKKESHRWEDLFNLHYFTFTGLILLSSLLFHNVSVPRDLLGFFDITMGSAFINGAIIYFRLTIETKIYRDEF